MRPTRSWPPSGCTATRGLLVTVTRNLRRQGRVFDLAAATVTLAEQAGYQYLQHVVALLAAVRDSRLAARPSFWQLVQTRRRCAVGSRPACSSTKTSWSSNDHQPPPVRGN